MKEINNCSMCIFFESGARFCNSKHPKEFACKQFKPRLKTKDKK